MAELAELTEEFLTEQFSYCDNGSRTPQCKLYSC